MSLLRHKVAIIDAYQDENEQSLRINKLIEQHQEILHLVKTFNEIYQYSNLVHSFAHLLYMPLMLIRPFDIVSLVLVTSSFFLIFTMCLSGQLICNRVSTKFLFFLKNISLFTSLNLEWRAARCIMVCQLAQFVNLIKKEVDTNDKNVTKHENYQSWHSSTRFRSIQRSFIQYLSSFSCSQGTQLNLNLLFSKGNWKLAHISTNTYSNNF